jgi:hypothetical protein
MKHRFTDSVHYVRVMDDEEIQMLGLVKLGVTGVQLPDRQAFICAEKLEAFTGANQNRCRYF